VVYAKDAMNGLDILNRLMDRNARLELEAQLNAQDNASVIQMPAIAFSESEQRSAKVSLAVPIPEAPDLERHVLEV
jgi:5-methyltetrahydrofolate--homocysteine methyltransferase